MKRAVALRYHKTDEAPVVVSAGEGDLAARIERAALDHGVPIVRDVPLADALAELRTGDPIPETLYEAVAAILRELVHDRPLTCALLTLALLLVAPRVRAEDPPTFADRADEEAPETERGYGFMCNPLAMAAGLFAGEADFVLGQHVAIAVEGGLYRRHEATATALGAALLVYPLGTAFHGLYLEPRMAYAHPLIEAVFPFDWGTDVIGFGATAGWQWTWDYGFSVRIGAGAMYFLEDPRRGSPTFLARGAQPVLDGSVGWTF